MLKTPRNLTVPLFAHTGKKTNKRALHSWSFTKTSYASMEHREYGMFGATEGGLGSNFFTSGSEITTFSKIGRRTMGCSCQRKEVGCWVTFWGFYLSADLLGMHEIHSLAHKLQEHTPSGQNRVKNCTIIDDLDTHKLLSPNHEVLLPILGEDWSLCEQGWMEGQPWRKWG